MWGIKRKGSFHAGRSLDSLLSRGWRGPIRFAGGPLRYTGLQMAGVWQEAGLFVGINLHLRWLVNLQDPHQTGTSDIVFHYLS